MVKYVQRVSDRLLGWVVPASTAQACRLESITCVGCPGSANYLFRKRYHYSCCGALQRACTFYSACNRTC